MGLFMDSQRIHQISGINQNDGHRHILVRYRLWMALTPKVREEQRTTDVSGRKYLCSSVNLYTITYESVKHVLSVTPPCLQRQNPGAENIRCVCIISTV